MNHEIKAAHRLLETAHMVSKQKGIPDPLDLTRRFSFGKQADALSMVDEHAKAIQLNWRIKNLTASTQTVAISSLITSAINNTQFADLSAMQTAVGATATLKDGIIIDGTDGADLTATSTDNDKKLDDFLRYIGKNPTRIVKLSMVSRNATSGAADSSNYDLKLRTVFASPFEVPVVKELNLRPLVPTGANFTESRLNVDFQRLAFPVVLSNENFATLQINANTELQITVYVGAQLSKAQSFWRDVKAADEVLRPELLKQM